MNYLYLVFRNIIFVVLTLLLVFFYAKGQKITMDNPQERVQFYEFPKNTIHCIEGDYVLQEVDNQGWRVYFVEDLFLLSRLIPFNSREKGNVLVEEIDFVDSKVPKRAGEIHVLLSLYEKKFSSHQEAVQAIEKGMLGESTQNLCKSIKEFPKQYFKVYKKKH